MTTNDVDNSSPLHLDEGRDTTFAHGRYGKTAENYRGDSAATQPWDTWSILYTDGRFDEYFYIA